MEWFRVHEHSFPSVASAPSPEESNDENSHPPNYTIESNRRGVEQAQPRAIPSNCSQTEAMIMPTARGFTHQSYQPEPEMETMMDEEAQLEQQLQYQREEMLQFRARPTLPRITPPSHPFQSQHAHSNHPSQPSHYGSTTNESPLLLQTPPTMHVSPFAGLALSAPSKSSMGRMNKPPVNPFGLGFSPSPSSNSFSFSMENSPRLPPINMLRSGSPHTMKNGIAGRSPILPLRSNSEPGAINQSSFTPVTSYFPSPQFDPIPSPSPPHQHSHHLPSLSSSLPTLASKSFSPSLPGLSFLHQRVLNPEPCEDISRIHDTMISSNDEEEDEERDSAMLMMRLSSSMPDTSAPRSGRVCRYMQCSNIARSRGLCRTHGGGKRCSHPLCDKSAQANRKCIAHGGGTPCSFDDCEKTAQSRGLCKAHGGGARCKYPNCPKSSQSKGFCRGHGGGIKCREQGCDKWVQKNGYCIKHGRERSLTIG